MLVGPKEVASYRKICYVLVTPDGEGGKSFV